MDVPEADTNRSDVLGSPLGNIVHFVKRATALGQGTSNFVYQNCPSKASVYLNGWGG